MDYSRRGGGFFLVGKRLGCGGKVGSLRFSADNGGSSGTEYVGVCGSVGWEQNESGLLRDRVEALTLGNNSNYTMCMYGDQWGERASAMNLLQTQEKMWTSETIYAQVTSRA